MTARRNDEMLAILIPVFCCLLGGSTIAFLMLKGMDEAQDSTDTKEK